MYHAPPHTHDEAALAKTLGLLYTAPERFSGVNGSIHGWTDMGLFAEAQRTWMDEQRALGSLVATLGRPSRRADDGTVAQTRQFAIVKGSARELGQSWLEQGISADRQVTPGAGALALAEMLQPLSLLSDAKFSVVGMSIVAGRRAIAVSARPRRQWHEYTDCRLWEGPDEHRFLVDAERGILLRATSMFRGRAFAGKELRLINFDSPLSSCEERWERLGEIANLLYQAQDNFATARASVRTWRFDKEFLKRFMATNPDHFREERIGNDGRVTGISAYHGDTWWHFALNQNYVNTNAPPVPISDPARVSVYHHPMQPGEARYAAMDGEYAITAEPVLNPSFLLHALWLEPVDRTTFAGRPAIRVSAKRNRNNGELRMWEAADEFELLVDAERGTLLRLGACCGGEEFDGHEVTEIEFDAPIPDDVFTFIPPSGTRVNVRRTESGG